LFFETFDTISFKSLTAAPLFPKRGFHFLNISCVKYFATVFVENLW